MIRIIFYGKNSTLSKLQAALAGFALVCTSGKADAYIQEVSGEEDIYSIPHKINMPVFIILSSFTPLIVEKLKNIKISGVFAVPLNAEQIKNKISLVLKHTEEKATSSPETTRAKILAKAEAITSLPIFARKLLLLTSDDKSTVEEITELIKMDQGISGRIIRMANSPFYGLKVNVTSIDRCVMLLGFHTVKNIALIASTNMYYNKPFAMYKTTGAAMWQHSYTVAILSEVFATHLGLNEDDCFIAGLFHDIGKTVMVEFLTQPAMSCEDEKAQLGLDHPEVAAMVLRRWQIAPEIINMVNRHHNPDDSLNSIAIYCANIIAHHSYDFNLLKQLTDNISAKLPCEFPHKLSEALYNAVVNSKEQ